MLEKNWSTALFRDMSISERTACLAEIGAGERAYQKDELIMHAGDVTDRLGVVLSGSVTIESNDVWGNCTILSHVGAGQVFAETYAMLPGEVMLVDVRANEDCRIGFLRVGRILEDKGAVGGAGSGAARAGVTGLGAECSGAASAAWQQTLLRNLLLITARKNLALSGRSFHTAPKSCRGRLLSYLNAMALQFGTTEFDIPFDRQQLADYLNLERTNMSKELGRMRREGIIQCRKSHFRLIRGQSYRP